MLADVVARLRAHPVLEETAALAIEWSRQAVVAIEELPEGEVKDALVTFAEALVARAS